MSSGLNTLLLSSSRAKKGAALSAKRGVEEAVDERVDHAVEKVRPAANVTNVDVKVQRGFVHGIQDDHNDVGEIVDHVQGGQYEQHEGGAGRDLLGWIGTWSFDFVRL